MKQHLLFNFKSVLSVIYLSFCALIVDAQTVFNGPPNGDWFAAANWSNGLPAVDNNATIPGGASVVINAPLSTDFKIECYGTLMNNSTLVIGNTFFSSGSFTNSSTITVNVNGIFTIEGQVTNAGTITNKGVLNANAIFVNQEIGIINNDGTFNQLATFTNDGIFKNQLGVFTNFKVFNNNKTVINLLDATIKLETTSIFTNAVGGDVSNAGTLDNFGSLVNNARIVNAGNFKNNGIQTCNGIFDNSAGGNVYNAGTIDLIGAWNNENGATIVSSKFIVKNFAFVQNAGIFQNSNELTVQPGGSFNNLAGGAINSSFGSKINNEGDMIIEVGSNVVTNGEINNTNFLQNYGTIESNTGAKILNSDRLVINGLLKNVNFITNNSEMIVTGTIENNSGGSILNSGILILSPTAQILNNFDITNSPNAAFRNDGVILNNLRLYNDGVFENNGTFIIAGDFYNNQSGIFNNAGKTEVKTGVIINQGQFNNPNSLINSACSTIRNLANINNTGGTFENQGIVFQRGTITGNAIKATSGIIQTGTSTEAPSVCLPSLNAGLDEIGEGKVYAQSLVNASLGLNDCTNFQYFVDGVNRKVYNCDQIGQTLTAQVKLLTRTGDFLTCTSQVTISDNVQPILTNCPTNMTVSTVNECSVINWTEPTAQDNCPNLTITVVSFPTLGLKNNSCFPLGNTTVTYNAKDANGYTASCAFTVNVTKIVSCLEDVEIPVLSNCPTNQTISTTENCKIATWTAPTVTDNCGTPSVILTTFPTADLNSGSCFPIGTTTVTYIAKDAKENKATCTFDIIVEKIDPCAEDKILPALTNCPEKQTVSTTENCKIAEWTAPTATDNCGTPSVILTTFPTADLNSGSCFPIGTTTVTYIAKDAKDNKATCTFDIIVEKIDPCAEDKILPVLSNCPTNQTVSTTENCKIATWITPTATDNCGTPSVILTTFPTADLNSGSCFPIGTTTVTYIAKDAKDNKATCTFDINVKLEPFKIDPDKCYKIVCKSGKVLDLEKDDFKDGTYINQSTYDNLPSQQWQFMKVKDGIYKIINRFNGKSLSCYNNKDGSSVYQWDNVNHPAKYWKIETMGNGFWRIINVLSKKSLDLLNNSSLEDALIGIWNYHGGNNQMWQIVEVPCQNSCNCIQYGTVKREVWYNQKDNSFPIVFPTTAPNLSTLESSLESARDIRENYETRVQGYFVAPMNGKYTFNITGDDDVALYISNGTSSKHLKQVAFLKGGTKPDEEHKYASQTSRTIHFKKDKLYYFEVHHKEGSGSDHYRVRWKMPNARNKDGFQTIDAQYLASLCSGQVQSSISNRVFTFETKAEYNQAKLLWITNTGYQNDFFEVERINSQGQFDVLEKINANTGNDVLKIFDFTDSDPLEGDNYYRIKTILLDGTPQYTAVKKVNFNRLSDVTVFPNPANDYIEIDMRRYLGKALNLYIYNQLGELMQMSKVEKVSSDLHRLDIQSFVAGTYLIRIQCSGTRELTKQFKIAH